VDITVHLWRILDRGICIALAILIYDIESAFEYKKGTPENLGDLHSYIWLKCVNVCTSLV
jgi:hypothetical protein